VEGQVVETVKNDLLNTVSSKLLLNLPGIVSRLVIYGVMIYIG
jgi:hypothetical protein